jgi:predicted nucleic acid-binding protein
LPRQLLAYLKDERAAGRIESEWIGSGAAISSIDLGEVLYIRIRATGEDSARADVETIRRRLTVVEPDWSLVMAATTIKASGGLSYADAFCVATALHRSLSHHQVAVVLFRGMLRISRCSQVSPALGRWRCRKQRPAGDVGLQRVASTASLSGSSVDLA